MTDRARPALLDTSVVVRYLVRSPPDQAAKAASLIDGSTTLSVSVLALAETAHVLTSVYRRPRADVVDALVLLLARENLRLLGLSKPLAFAALQLCRGSNRTSFTDALLWAEARQLDAGTIYTFDRRFPTEGVHVTKLR